MTHKRLFMNDYPRFEEVCTLAAERSVEGGRFLGEIHFGDLHGEPGPEDEDIDLRNRYPRGSSAFSENVRPDMLAHFPGLGKEFDADNAGGHLNRLPYRDSFVWVTKQLYSLGPVSGADAAAFRRKVIQDLLDPAGLVLIAYSDPSLYGPLADLGRGMRAVQQQQETDRRKDRGKLGRNDLPQDLFMLARKLPDWEKFRRSFTRFFNEAPSPFTLAGYAYLRFVRGDSPEEISVHVARWLELFEQVRNERHRVFQSIRSRTLEVYAPHGETPPIAIVHLDVRHDFETSALFQTRKGTHVIVAIDRRRNRTAILTRHNLDLTARWRRLYERLDGKEPGVWRMDGEHTEGRTPMLLSKWPDGYDGIAADPDRLLPLIAATN